MFTEVLYTLAKCWKQPKCPSADEWIKKLWYIYTVEYWEAEKKKGSHSCNSCHGTREYYTKLNKPIGKRQIQYDVNYKRNVMDKIN